MFTYSRYASARVLPTLGRWRTNTTCQPSMCSQNYSVANYGTTQEAPNIDPVGDSTLNSSDVHQHRDSRGAYQHDSMCTQADSFSHDTVCTKSLRPPVIEGEAHVPLSEPLCTTRSQVKEITGFHCSQSKVGHANTVNPPVDTDPATDAPCVAQEAVLRGVKGDPGVPNKGQLHPGINFGLLPEQVSVYQQSDVLEERTESNTNVQSQAYTTSTPERGTIQGVHSATRDVDAISSTGSLEVDTGPSTQATGTDPPVNLSSRVRYTTTDPVQSTKSDGPFRFEVIHESKKSGARVGVIHTPHGVITTPNFVGVGTNGTIKGLTSEMTRDTGLELMFCNTYHLLLHPGPEIIKAAGGLHRYANYKGPIITDSGGFQVFSLMYHSVHSELKSKGIKSQNSLVLKIDEEGVTFRSYRDGQKVCLTPESSVQCQKAYGSDVIIPLDELPPYHTDHAVLLEKLERTHRWEVRSLREHLKSPNDQAMYSVIHGGISKALRQQSAEFLARESFDGHAIGGSVGKNIEELIDVVRHTVQFLPPHQPRHLLGIADLPSAALCVPLGIDTFDSAYPSRLGRHGTLFTSRGQIKIRSGKWANVHEPIDPLCSCSTCRNYSAAYVHHLFKAYESTGPLLATIHNMTYMVDYFKKTQQAILNDEI